VGSFQVVDATPITTHTYTLVAGIGDSGNSRFQIIGNALQVLTSADYETANSHSVRVRVTNSDDRFFEEVFVITVQDQGPTSVTLGVSSILEGRPSGTAVGTFSATVLPFATSITSYQLVSGAGSADNTLFSIDGTTLKTASVLDHEASGTRSIRVRATDAYGETFDQSLVITVANVTISDLTLSSSTVLENLPADTLVATLALVVTPTDPGATPVFSIVSATPSNALTLASGNQLRTTRTLLRPEEPTLAVRLSVVHLGETLEKNFTIQVNANAPLISLEHPVGTPLVDGEASILFGDVVVGSSTTRVITVHNGGNANLTGLTLEWTGPETTTFSVTSPAVAPVLPGESTSFTLQFAPSVEGPQNANLRLVSNDYDEGLFDLTLTGTGLAPQIAVSGAGQAIASGDSTPSLADHTDFGSVALLDTQLTRTFTLSNPGTSTLNLTGDPLVQISGPNAADFKVTTSPASEVADGASSSLSITFDPQLPGPRSAVVSISSDDRLIPTYTFSIAGFGALAKPLPQTIAFTVPSTVYLDEISVTLEPYATSGLPVTLSLISGPATLTGNVLTLTGVGTIQMLATQLGGGTYAPARSVKRTIKVKPSPSVLTLVRLSQRFNGTPRAIGVLGTSETPVVTYNVGGTFVPDPPTSAGRYPVKAQVDGKSKTGTLVITPAPLFVTPDDKRKFAGQANPALTFHTTGWVPGDMAAALTSPPDLRTTAKPNSPGGTYPITTRGGTTPNYLLVRQSGTLVVESFTGTYEILLLDGLQLPAGKLSLTVAKSGRSFTGKLFTTQESLPLSLSGTLLTDSLIEQATATATRIKNGFTYAADFTLPLYGLVSASATRDATLLGTSMLGQKMLTLSGKQSVPHSGAHTAILEPATPADQGLPVGAGWATAVISKKGLLTLVGRLGDGTPFTAAQPSDRLEKPGYRLFVQPYKPARPQAFIGGSIEFAQHPTMTNRRRVDPTGLHWTKAAQDSDLSYRAGFNTSTHLLIDPWIIPKSPDTLALRLGLPGNTFTVSHSLTGSSSDPTLPTSAALDIRNRVSVLAPANDTQWKATLNPSKGTFTARFQLQDGTQKRTVQATGVLRQPAEPTDDLIGDGHFILPALTGAPSNEKRTGELIFRHPAP
jgi:hypothetical protein